MSATVAGGLLAASLAGLGSTQAGCQPPTMGRRRCGCAKALDNWVLLTEGRATFIDGLLAVAVPGCASATPPGPSEPITDTPLSERGSKPHNSDLC